MLTGRTLRGYLFVIVSAVIFGCNALTARYMFDIGVNSLTLVFLRNVLSIPVLGILGYRMHSSLKIPAKALAPISAIAVMGCCMTPALLFTSYLYIASGTATVFHFIYPAAVMLGEVLVFRKKMKMGSIISVVLCVTGICMFYNPGQPLNPAGSALALLSGVTYAAYILLIANFRFPGIRGFLLSFYVSIISSIVMFALCSISGMLTLPATALGWAYSLFYSLLVNVGAVVLFQQGTFLIGGEKASILSTLEPITGMIVGVLVFRETVGGLTVPGALLVIGAAVLITLTDRKDSQ